MIGLNFEQSVIETEQRLSDDLLRRIELAVNSDLSADGDISIRFVTDSEIRRLNRMYRKKDEVTDVLSFGYPDNKENIGDIAISYDEAVRQASGSVEHEVVDLVVHGILHVLGYDHEKPGEDKEMFSLQDKIVEHII
ncbi:rRNA maturation RNase YbeY [Candidatus Uhrbacteria bacterium]|jgi:probable rRNA maturation factor|nr:rRNA maturation RNase YbeY [Candidatus Uhrbacteria bacterium]MBT7716759.1 rRNA maturation RNase YbeY [Candidatus Uhrbacteria bacterium]